MDSNRSSISYPLVWTLYVRGEPAGSSGLTGAPVARPRARYVHHLVRGLPHAKVYMTTATGVEHNSTIPERHRRRPAPERVQAATSLDWCQKENQSWQTVSDHVDMRQRSEPSRRKIQTMLKEAAARGQEQCGVL